MISPHKIFEARRNKIDFTDDQKKALLLLDAFKRSKDLFFLLAGNAGTGKTTIAENIANYTNAYMIAPTNAAVKRLRDKFMGKTITEDRFSTIHQVMYGAPNKFSGEFSSSKLKGLMKDTTYIVDESSMIDDFILKDLLKQAVERNAKLIFLGDDFQLEPVGKDPKLFDWELSNQLFEEEWRVKLQEVRRNEGAILRVATHLRNTTGEQILNLDTHDFSIVPKFSSEILLDIRDDKDFVVLVATNKDRMNYNNHIRKARYGEECRGNVILNGEKVISVANQQFLNGEQYTIKHPEILQQFREKINIGSSKYPNWSTFDFYLIQHEVEGSNKSFKTLLIPQLDKPSLHGAMLLTSEVIKQNKDIVKFNSKFFDYKVLKTVNIATYGYATSVHKSQGNEWDNVYIDCSWLSDNWNKSRWLYTALTRAKKKVELKFSHQFKVVEP